MVPPCIEVGPLPISARVLLRFDGRQPFPIFCERVDVVLVLPTCDEQTQLLTNFFVDLLQ
jgi:hypothetical protein